MRPDDPLPRLLRLHGMVARAAPGDRTQLDYSHAEGLTETYVALRDATRALVADLRIDVEEFDRELEPLEPARPIGHPNPRGIAEASTRAATAATRLRALRGYIEGLITMTALTEDLSPEQIELVRTTVSGH